MTRQGEADPGVGLGDGGANALRLMISTAIHDESGGLSISSVTFGTTASIRGAPNPSLALLLPVAFESLPNSTRFAGIDAIVQTDVGQTLLVPVGGLVGVFLYFPHTHWWRSSIRLRRPLGKRVLHMRDRSENIRLAVAPWDGLMRPSLLPATNILRVSHADRDLA